MGLKRKDIVIVDSLWVNNKDIDYYDIGVIQSIEEEGVYVKIFEQNGSLSDYTSRYRKNSLEKISVEKAVEVLKKSAFTQIKDSIEELKEKGEL